VGTRENKNAFSSTPLPDFFVIYYSVFVIRYLYILRVFSVIYRSPLWRGLSVNDESRRTFMFIDTR